MKLVVFSLFLILGGIIKNFESVSAKREYFENEYFNRKDAEEKCVDDDVRMKNIANIHQINFRVKVYVCKGDKLKSFFTTNGEAKKNCVIEVDGLYYCKYNVKKERLGSRHLRGLF